MVPNLGGNEDEAHTHCARGDSIDPSTTARFDVPCQAYPPTSDSVYEETIAVTEWGGITDGLMAI
jgi:hypothetical protein